MARNFGIAIFCVPFLAIFGVSNSCSHLMYKCVEFARAAVDVTNNSSGSAHANCKELGGESSGFRSQELASGMEATKTEKNELLVIRDFA
jgi:hypothetical protein